MTEEQALGLDIEKLRRGTSQQFLVAILEACEGRARSEVVSVLMLALVIAHEKREDRLVLFFRHAADELEKNSDIVPRGPVT